MEKDADFLRGIPLFEFLDDEERIRADIEYEVNLRAELEIGHLHEKLDHLNVALLERLEKIQRLLDAR